MTDLLNTYLASVPTPMARAKAKAALLMIVCVNGDKFMERRELLESRIAAGSKVVDRRGDMVLLNADGSWLDQRNATKHGLNYAAWLSVHRNAA